MENISSKSTENATVLKDTVIPNSEALMRRANKLISDWNIYPAIPTRGDLSFAFIANVKNFDPLSPLQMLKSAILDMMMEQTNYEYDYEDFSELLIATFGKEEKNLKTQILKALIEDCKSIIQTMRMKYDNLMSLRPDETTVFYYSYSIYKIANQLGIIDGLFFARQALQALDNFYCEKSNTPYFGISRSGKFLSLSEFKEDRQLYNYVMNLIEAAIKENGGETAEENLNKIHGKEKAQKTKMATGKATNILIRIAMVFAVWLLCGVYTRIVPFNFDSWIILASQAIVMLSTILFNLKHNNLAAVIIMDIVIAALLYPICWVVSFFALGIILFGVFIVLSFYSFTRSD